MRNLLRIRDVRIYLLGDVVSTLGDNALWLAMAIWIKEMTGSSAWAGLVFFSFAVGNLFSPLGGVLADRFRRKPLLICANLLAAALVLLILLDVLPWWWAAAFPLAALLYGLLVANVCYVARARDYA